MPISRREFLASAAAPLLAAAPSRTSSSSWWTISATATWASPAIATCPRRAWIRSAATACASRSSTAPRRSARPRGSDSPPASIPARHLINTYLNSRKTNRENGMRDWLDPAAPCVARTFRDAGYATGHFGKWHMGGGRDVGDAPLPQAYGFQTSLTSFEGLGDRVLIEKDSLSKQSAALGRGKIQWAPKSESDRNLRRSRHRIHARATEASRSTSTCGRATFTIRTSRVRS